MLLNWQPSDCVANLEADGRLNAPSALRNAEPIVELVREIDETRIKSIRCWSNDHHLTNLNPPCLLDATKEG